MLVQSIFVATMLAVANATCMGHLHRRATESNTVEVSKFGYSGRVGPLLWQTLAAENTACEKGENQSPINIGKLLSFTLRLFGISNEGISPWQLHTDHPSS
jgi:carbonic anhydrase